VIYDYTHHFHKYQLLFKSFPEMKILDANKSFFANYILYKTTTS